jgi:dolichol-phosphate mannosyltransferase
VIQLPWVSIILPTYNEADNIEALAQAILAAITWPCEVLIVDDNSPDGTWRIAEDLSRRDPRVRLLRRVSERGLTSAIQAGIDASSGSVIVWMDCDFSHPPDVVPKLVKQILLERCDLAIASLYLPGGQGKTRLAGSRDTRLGAWLSYALNISAVLILGAGVRDYTSGFIAVRREVLESIRPRGDYGEYFIDLVARARRRGYRLLEISFVSPPRQRGSAKTGTNLGHYLRRGGGYLITVLRLRLGS